MNKFEEFSNMIESNRDYNINQENAIEFLKGSKVATVTFSQSKWINKIKRLSSQYPEEVQIKHTNEDGSIVAYIPTKYIHISKPSTRTMSEEERKKARERLRNFRKSKGGNLNEEEV